MSTRQQLTLLRSDALDGICSRGHFQPSEDLARYVAVGWMLDWNLKDDQTFTQQVLPNPSVHIAISTDQDPEVVGIATGAFSATFQGRSFVFGLRFRPCGFYPFVRQPVAAFTDRNFPVRHVLPTVDATALRRLADARNGRGLMNMLETELRKLAPEAPDPTGTAIESLIGRMESDAKMLTVEQAAREFGVSVRSLQRMFRIHVGVSPKWVLRRFRLKEAAARAETGQAPSWAELAQQLGYFDQSHLIRDFKAMVGRPPAAFRTGTSARTECAEDPRPQ